MLGVTGIATRTSTWRLGNGQAGAHRAVPDAPTRNALPALVREGGEATPTVGEDAAGGTGLAEESTGVAERG